MPTILTDRQTILDFVTGLAFLGTAGSAARIEDALETNRPLSTRGDVTAGRKVAVFGMKALDPVWHTPAGLALLGPRHFGFDFDYVPIDHAQ